MSSRGGIATGQSVDLPNAERVTQVGEVLRLRSWTPLDAQFALTNVTRAVGAGLVLYIEHVLGLWFSFPWIFNAG